MSFSTPSKRVFGSPSTVNQAFNPGLRWITSASETWAFTIMLLMSANVRMLGACCAAITVWPCKVVI
ncbi:hypothetical protein D3C78_1724600 [compost metagenome]